MGHTYGHFQLYGGFLYGGEATNNITWLVNVDWDEDGSYDGLNEAPFMFDYMVTRGRQFYLQEGANFQPFEPGRATISLYNTTGRYDPFNTDSVLYPNVDTGKFIRIIAEFEGINYPRFAGIIEDIRPIRVNGLEAVQIDILDGWAWLNNHFTAAAVETVKDTGDAITDILTDADWPAIWGSTIGAGADDIPYWWEDYRPAAEAINDLVAYENGRFWIGADGSANYENRQIVGEREIELTEDKLLKEVMMEMPWNAERNVVRIISHPIKTIAETVLWTLQDIPEIAASESLEIIVDFTYDGIQCPGDDLVTPVENTDYEMNTAADGSGADKSADFAVTIEATWGQRALLKYTNNGGTAAHVTLGQLRGDALTRPDQIEATDDQRVGSEQPKLFLVDSQHLQSSTNAPVLADYYASFITATKLFPNVMIENRFEEQFTPDLLSRVGVDIPTKGVEDKSYRLGYMEERWLHPNGQSLQSIFRFEPTEEATAYWQFPAQIGIDTIFVY